MNIEPRLNEFQSDARSLDSSAIFTKFFCTGSSFVLTDGKYAELKARIAAQFGIHANNVLMVGSAKVGFSIKPERRYGAFNDESDIDMAIISNQLFEKLWKSLYNYNRQGGWWPKIEQFKKFLFFGWIRPDKLPPSRSFLEAAEWWNFFEELTSSGDYGPYKIRAGLYYDWSFLESFQNICIDQCIAHERGVA